MFQASNPVSAHTAMNKCTWLHVFMGVTWLCVCVLALSLFLFFFLSLSLSISRPLSTLEADVIRCCRLWLWYAFELLEKVEPSLMALAVAPASLRSSKAGQAARTSRMHSHVPCALASNSCSLQCWQVMHLTIHLVLRFAKLWAPTCSSGIQV